MLSPKPPRLPFVEAVKARGKLYLYYRRDGRRLPLAGPEGSAEFLSDYDRAHATFERPISPWNQHTLGQAIEDYLDSADVKCLAARTQANYRRTLAPVQAHAGATYIEHIDEVWIERLRDRYAANPTAWNSLRSRMAGVFDRYRKLHKKRLLNNPWRDVRRLKVAQSDQNRRWPDSVVLAVMRAATPEFRALLVTLLLTSQRISDVTAFTPEQYDPQEQTLVFRQGKTSKPQLLHVPAPLAEIFLSMRGRRPDRLLVTPRGRAWKPINAEETLLVLRRNLGLGQYTLHGLRATGPTALKMLGFENRPIRALTGHDSDRNLEIYLRGVADYDMARTAQETLGSRFGEVLRQSTETGNQRKFSGLTGRAAARKNRTDANITPDRASDQTPSAAKQLPNAKRSTG